MDWRKKEQERLKANLANNTFVGTKGELRWKSNPKSVIPLEVFRDAGVTPPAAQAECSEEHIASVLADYRASQAELENNAEYQAQMAFERRAAFGPGAITVNVITGKTYK